MQFTLKSTRLALRNSTTRLPFRYGKACLTRCPQAVLAAEIETSAGRSTGYAGDCLPPGWFDKSPGKDFPRQIQEMLEAIRFSEETYRDAAQRPTKFFALWRTCQPHIHRWAGERGFTPLLASFGGSMVERAVMDALARAAQLSFAEALQADLFDLRPAELFAELADCQVRDWLPKEPRPHVYVRHTVGLADPLTTAEIPAEERLEDGFPQSLEEYIQETGLRYFKIKVSNRLDDDLLRLETIARLIQTRRGADYQVTLDGNEQYASAEPFDQLINRIETSPALATFWANTLWIEQPLDRSIALDSAHTGGIRDLAQRKAVIIDESDGQLDSFRQASELGYRGVSSKNCKGPVKSLLNAGLVWRRNQQSGRGEYVISGEDLCSVGVIPTQSDLCLTAALGLEHVERNGHHYHRGLSYLTESEQAAALAAHPDFYVKKDDVVSPRLEDGRFRIGSLQCPGFGFRPAPDFAQMIEADDWRFESLDQ